MYNKYFISPSQKDDDSYEGSILFKAAICILLESIVALNAFTTRICKQDSIERVCDTV
jgi:hypothetical protein